MITAEIKRPNGVTGVMSPYPTVVMVTIAQYMLLGMLLKPESGTLPSIMYIMVPIDVTSISTKKKNMRILGALIHNERSSRLPSLMKVNSLKMRKIRIRRKALITRR